MGQHDLLGQRLHQLGEPAVTSGCLDNHLEGSEAAEELDDLVGLVAGKGLPCKDGLFLIHDAHGDRLLVEVDADKVHCRAPKRGTEETGKTTQVFPGLRESANARRRPSLPSHSFNL